MRERRGFLVARVVRVHENVGADLQLGIDAAGRFESEGAGPRAADDGTVETRVLERGHRFARERDSARDARTPFVGGALMLRPPLIGLQAAEAQPAAGGDPLRQSRDSRTGRDAAAVHADIDLDERRQAQACILRSRFESRDAGLGVDADRRRADAAERGETGELAGAGDLVANENVPYPAPGQNLRFRRPSARIGRRRRAPSGGGR